MDKAANRIHLELDMAYFLSLVCITIVESEPVSGSILSFYRFNSFEKEKGGGYFVYLFFKNPCIQETVQNSRTSPQSALGMFTAGHVHS